jgi:hypothetical protein
MIWEILGSLKMAFTLSVSPWILLALSLAILTFWVPPFVLVSRGVSQRPVDVHRGALSMGSARAVIEVVVAW